MNKELIEAMRHLEEQKNLQYGSLKNALEGALAKAYGHDYHIASDNDVEVVIDPETGDIKVTLVDKQEDDEGNVTEERRDVTPDNFGRVAAQVAKQVIHQTIKEAERDQIYEDYLDKVGEIVTGIIEQTDHRYTIINLGQAEALLPQHEQVPGERYDHGARIKTYIVEVNKTTKEPPIVVSRSHPGLIRRLFELEVPEILNGYVEIRSVAREPGHRSKISVVSREKTIDPVGACVGPKGSRVRMVVSELKGEKIDIVPWSEDAATYVASALSPAKVKQVTINESAKSAEVVVSDDQLSLAIGKEGQNARLAAKLTGWRIDIRSESNLDKDEEGFRAEFEPDIAASNEATASEIESSGHETDDAAQLVKDTAEDAKGDAEVTIESSVKENT